MSDCPKCDKPLDEHPTIRTADQLGGTLYICQDRAAKWQRVEPGTVIPAGQPYRTENDDPLAVTMDGVRRLASEFVRDYDWTTKSDVWFVDSSWKPPLVLPTEPGSVIEAENIEGGTKSRLWMRRDVEGMPWIGDTGAACGSSVLRVIRVLFDAGADR